MGEYPLAVDTRHYHRIILRVAEAYYTGSVAGNVRKDHPFGNSACYLHCGAVRLRWPGLLLFVGKVYAEAGSRHIENAVVVLDMAALAAYQETKLLSGADPGKSRSSYDKRFNAFGGYRIYLIF